MKSVLVAGTVITNKKQAVSLVERLTDLFEYDNMSVEAAIAIDEMEQRLVDAGILDWTEIQAAETRQLKKV